MNKNYYIFLILLFCNFGCNSSKNELNCFFDNNSIYLLSKDRDITFDLKRNTFYFKRKQNTFTLRGDLNDIKEIEINTSNLGNVVILRFASKLSPSFSNWEEFTLGTINNQCKHDFLNSGLQFPIYVNNL